MSWNIAADPVCRRCESTNQIELIIEGQARDLDGLPLRRVLPSPSRRMIGPFVFFDHMGPGQLPAGRGIDVRPHPHINLATVTYLMEGEIVHRDSLGSYQPIRPGAINWMSAGRGIVHSERSPAAERRRGPRLHGFQLWVALPREHEEIEPSFRHCPAAAIPEVDVGGVRVRVLAGSAYGKTSPVQVLSPLFYAEAAMRAGDEIELPTDYQGRAAYVAEGAVRCGAETIESSRMVVFSAQVPAALKAESDVRLILLGGEPLEGERHIWWNFVSSSQARIERAKADWREGRFPCVPGDEQEYIPLPQ